VNINATPWAEVWIDGKSFGETPLGNISVAPGEHEIVVTDESGASAVAGVRVESMTH